MTNKFARANFQSPTNLKKNIHSRNFQTSFKLANIGPMYTYPLG